MPAEDPPRLPIEAVRDLLGIVRALYAAWREQGFGPIEMDELREIGRDLADALELGSKTAPDTMGHRAAWRKAERATQRLGDLIGALIPLQPVVRAAMGRIVQKSMPRTSREEKREHRRRRG